MNRWVLALSVAVALVASLVPVGSADAADDPIRLADIQLCPDLWPAANLTDQASPDPMLEGLQVTRAERGLGHQEADVWASLVEDRYVAGFGAFTPAEEAPMASISNSTEPASEIADSIGVPSILKLDWLRRKIVVDVETQAERAAYLAEADRRIANGGASPSFANHLEVVASGTPWRRVLAEYELLGPRLGQVMDIGLVSVASANADHRATTIEIDRGGYEKHAELDVSALFDGVDLDYVCLDVMDGLVPEPPQPVGERWVVIGEGRLDGLSFANSRIEVVGTPSELAEVWPFEGGAPDFDPLDKFVVLATAGVGGSCFEVNLEAVIRNSDGLTLDFKGYRQHYYCAGGWGSYRFAVLIDRDLAGSGEVVIRDERGYPVVAAIVENGVPVRAAEPTIPAPHDAAIIPISDRTLAPGGGTWWVDRGGGVYAMGGAAYLGGMGGIAIDEPIVSIVATPSGGGYWLFAEDGGVFAFGDAPFVGSIPGVLPPGVGLAAPIIDAAATPSGRGYWLAASDGGVFAFGDAEYLGSIPEAFPPSLGVDVTGFGVTSDGTGYVFTDGDGQLVNFGSVDVGVGDPQLSGVDDVVVSPGGGGFLMVDGFTATELGDADGLEHPSESMLEFCAPGKSRHSGGYESNELNTITPYGWSPAATPDGELRSRPALADGIWLQVDNVYTDPIGGRQVWIDRNSIGSFEVDGYTRCV